MPRVRWKDGGCVHSGRAQAEGCSWVLQRLAAPCSWRIARRASPCAPASSRGAALHVLICDDERGRNLDVNSARSRASWQQVRNEDAMVVRGVGRCGYLLVALTLRCTCVQTARALRQIRLD
jgi:hypothetical protein